MSACQDSGFSEGGTNQVTGEKYVSIYGECSHSVGTGVFMCLCACIHEGDTQAHTDTAV